MEKSGNSFTTLSILGAKSSAVSHYLEFGRPLEYKFEPGLDDKAIHILHFMRSKNQI